MRRVRGILGFLMVVGLCGGWFLFLRPQSLGGSTGYVMIRGISMNPKYHSYDLVLTRKQPSYKRGDIVAYHVPKGQPGEGIVVIHRIIGGSGTEGFVLQGDNNPQPDDWHPKTGDVVGKAWVMVPQVGKILAFLHAPVPLASLAAGVAIAMVLVPGDDKKKAEEREEPDRPAAPLPVPVRAALPTLADLGPHRRVFAGLAVWDSVRAAAPQSHVSPAPLYGADLDDVEAVALLFKLLSGKDAELEVTTSQTLSAGRTRP